MGVPKTRTGELPSVKKPRTFQKHLQLQVERSTCRRDSHNVVRSSAPRWAALTPELSQPLRWAQSPGVCAAVTGKVPGSGLPADPGEGGGAPSARPGAWTLAVV